jgi:hypothetical protein
MAWIQFPLKTSDTRSTDSCHAHARPLIHRMSAVLAHRGPNRCPRSCRLCGEAKYCKRTSSSPAHVGANADTVAFPGLRKPIFHGVNRALTIPTERCALPWHHRPSRRPHPLGDPDRVETLPGDAKRHGSGFSIASPTQQRAMGDSARMSLSTALRSASPVTLRHDPRPARTP